MSSGSPRMAALAVLVGLFVGTAAAQNDAPADSTPAAGPAVAPRTAALDDPWSNLEAEFSERESHAIQRPPAKSISPALAKRGESNNHSWARTIGALAGVTGLIILLAWGYRAMAGGNLPLVGKARRPGLIEVISKTPLSARQSLCLVRVGPRLVLIGQSQDTLRALDVIDDAHLAAQLAGEAARGRAHSSQNEFHECLRQEARGYHADDGDENITPDEERIADTRQTVTRTIRRIREVVGQI